MNVHTLFVRLAIPALIKGIVTITRCLINAEGD